MVTKKAKTAQSVAAKKSTAAVSAKRKADALKTQETTEQAVVSTIKTKAQVAKKKLPRALAGLTSNLNWYR